MTPPLACPVASRFIETADDARAYYRFRLVGDHAVTVCGVPLVVRFNPEETHLFTDDRQPCPPGDVVRRAGASGELRCFSVVRARALDLVVPTVAAPVKALVARVAGGVQLFGPPDPASTRRVCVVVAPSGRAPGVYFVRTAYDVTPDAYRRALASSRPAPWPPKENAPKP